MEQKQLDELDDSFFGEEFIEDEAEESFSSNTKFQRVEPKLEAEAEPELRLKKSAKKTVAKKNTVKKTEKTIKKEAVSEAKKEKALPEKEVKKETVEIKPAKETPKETKIVVETSSPVNPWAEEKGSGLFGQASTWKTLTGIALVLLVLSLFTQGFDFSEKGLTGAATISLDEAKDKALTYVNGQLLQPPFQATVEASEELDSLYKITLNVAGQTVDSYVTKDGKLFFPQGLEMEAVVLENGETETPSNSELAPVEVSVDDDPALGLEDAPVTMVEFSDFQCPFCKKANDEALKEVKDKYVEAGKLKIVYRDFPLEFHPEAEVAAIAAECADEQGKFWEYHDLLFANQDSLSDANYKKWAVELGLDEEEFNECYKGLEYLNEVRADMADGQKYGVSGTPAFFINGRMISGAQPYAVFEQEIEAALAAAGVESEAVNEPELAPNEPEEAGATEVVPEPAMAGETVKVTLNAKKWIFQPNEVTVKKGSKVVVTVVPSGLDFTFAVPALGVEQKVAGTTEVEFVADKAGTFDFTCGSCEDWRGMKGTLVVE
ncbi:thioredoxin domain-containing protein [Candidatus Woesearchaeota archaeon]|nr:thioredoxin domain-containing protein [Candidatus Woesearchaeota archaeon]